MHVALQILDTTGNVALFCNNGRSRSPTYLVVYVMIVYGWGAQESVTCVRNALLEQRNETLDRFGCLMPLVEEIWNILK